MENDSLCPVIELNLKVLLEDLANDCMCHKPDLCIFRFDDDRVFRLYERAFGR